MSAETKWWNAARIQIKKKRAETEPRSQQSWTHTCTGSALHRHKGMSVVYLRINYSRKRQVLGCTEPAVGNAGMWPDCPRPPPTHAQATRSKKRYDLLAKYCSNRIDEKGDNCSIEDIKWEYGDEALPRNQYPK